MWEKNTISKYFILSIIILGVGLPSAYAITITLGGDPVIINGILDMMGNRMTNVGTPTASTDAATKAYVDSAPGTDTLASLGCAADEVAKFSGSVWECVQVSAELNPTFLIDSTDDVGERSSIAIGNDGFPIISYFDATNNDLKVVHCTSVTCSTFDTPTAIDSASASGVGTSLAIGTDNLPIIANFVSSPDLDLKVVHCTNASCSTFDTPTPVATAGNVGQQPSIAIGSDNFPVISYFNSTGSSLQVSHCTNTSCSSFDPPSTLDSADFVGQYSSIAIGSDGFPIISYYDNTNSDTKVVHCTNVSCSMFDTPTTVDTEGFGATAIGIGSDNLPIVAYYTGALKTVHCTNTSCSSVGTPRTIDSDGGDTGWVANRIIFGSNGFPIIAYEDFGNDLLKIAYCVDVLCLNAEKLTLTGGRAFEPSVAMGSDGKPIISHDNFEDDDLEVTIDGIVISYS